MIASFIQSRWGLLAIGGLVFLVFVSTGWYAGSGRWSGDRAKLLAEADAYKSVLLRVREERQRRPALDERGNAILDRSLGGELEHVDAALRARLVEVGEDAGLRDLVVSTSGVVAIESPARREFKRTARERRFRDEADFVILRASIAGEGSLEQVVEAIHVIDSAPWLKRIDSIRLDPNADGSRIRMGLGVSTLFVPGHESTTEILPSDPPRRPRERYAELVAMSPFKVPVAEPVQVVATPRPVRPRPPKIDPRSQWQLTGLIEGDPGVEAWVRHLGTGRTLTLIPDVDAGLGGGVVVRLVGIAGDVATLQIENETYRVLVGSTLDRPLRERTGLPSDQPAPDRTDS